MIEDIVVDELVEEPTIIVNLLSLLTQHQNPTPYLICDATIEMLNMNTVKNKRASREIRIMKVIVSVKYCPSFTVVKKFDCKVSSAKSHFRSFQ